MKVDREPNHFHPNSEMSCKLNWKTLETEQYGHHCTRTTGQSASTALQNWGGIDQCRLRMCERWRYRKGLSRHNWDMWDWVRNREMVPLHSCMLHNIETFEQLIISTIEPSPICWDECYQNTIYPSPLSTAARKNKAYEHFPWSWDRVWKHPPQTGLWTIPKSHQVMIPLQFSHLGSNIYFHIILA